MVLCLPNFVVSPVMAEPPPYFAEPPTPEYYRGPPGHGTLEICKLDDAPDVKFMRIPMGTYFADSGPINNNPGTAEVWLLTLVTTKSIVLKPGQICGKVSARIEPAAPPPAHPEMQPVLRFEKADQRYFEISAPDDLDAPLPNLAPWNSDFPSLKATAISNFE